MSYRIEVADGHFFANEYDKALPIYKRILSRRGRIIEPIHADILEIRRKMALIYEELGKNREAVRQYKIICEAYERKSDADSISVLEIKSRYAELLKHVGQHSEAMDIWRYIETMLKCRADKFEKRCKVGIPFNYFDTVQSYHDFAKSHLGSGHETTIRMREVVGDIRSLREEYDHALVSYSSVLFCLEGKDAPDTDNILRVKIKMASMEKKTGSYEDALETYKSISDIYKRRQPLDYISIWQTDHCIVEVLREIGKQRQSDKYLNYIKVHLKDYANNFVELRNVLSSELYSEICRELCREIVEEKFNLAKKGFEYMQSFLTCNNEDTLRMRWTIGFMYRLMERYKDSLQIYEEVYEKCLSYFGPNHSLTINSCLDRVSLLRFLCDFQEAHAVLNDLFKKRKAFLKHNKIYDDVTLKIRYECANIFYEEGAYAHALGIYADIYTNCNSNDELTLDARRMFAKTAFKVGYRETAVTFIKQFYDDTPNLDHLNVGHLRKKGVIRFLFDIADINEQLGEYDRAVNIYESMQGICRTKGIKFPLHIRSKIAIIRAKQDKQGIGHVEIFQGLIKECETIRNPGHFLSSSIQKGLAIAYFNHSGKEEREQVFMVYKKLLRANEEMLGCYHSDTLNVKYLWAKCYLAPFTYPLIMMKNMFEEIREIRCAILYRFHPDCLSVSYHLAETNERVGFYDEAFKIYCDIYTETGLYYGVDNRYLTKIKNRIDRIVNRIQEPNLITATIEANLNEVLSCLSNGDDVNVRGTNGFTPLHIASQRGYVEIAKCLLNHGASYEFKNWDWKTPADIARDDATTIILLKVDQLFFSVKCNDVKSVKRIVQQESALVNAKDNNGFSPLHCATYKGYRDIVKFLLDNGADAKSRVSTGYLSLHLAAIKGDNEMILILVKHIEDNLAEDLQEMFNDNKNLRGVTPLHLAALKNHVSTVDLLRFSPEYREKRDKLGRLPIDLATGRKVKRTLQRVQK